MKTMNLEATAWRRDALEGEVLDEEGLARRRRRIRIAVIISALLLVAVVAYLAMSGGDEKGQAAAAGDASKGGGATAPTVSVVVPGRQLVERTISATGTIGARRGGAIRGDWRARRRPDRPGRLVRGHPDR